MKLAEYRANFGNPLGSDVIFNPNDPEGIIDVANSVVGGLVVEKSMHALHHHNSDPKCPDAMQEVEDALDMTDWYLGKEETQPAEMLPNRKRKRGKKRR